MSVLLPGDEGERVILPDHEGERGVGVGGAVGAVHVEVTLMRPRQSVVIPFVLVRHLGE